MRTVTRSSTARTRRYRRRRRCGMRCITAFVDTHRGLRLNDFLQGVSTLLAWENFTPASAQTMAGAFYLAARRQFAIYPNLPRLCPPPSFLITSQFGEIGLASAPFLLRPPLQNARSLPDRYPDPRPVL